METIVQRLKKYLDFIGVSVSVAEKKINLSNGSLSKPFNANTTIKTDTLEKFLKIYYEISSDWLLTGKGEMLKKSDNLPDVVEGVNYKELAEARLEIIEGLKFKISMLQKELDQTKSTATLAPKLERELVKG